MNKTTEKNGKGISAEAMAERKAIIQEGLNGILDDLIEMKLSDEELEAFALSFITEAFGIQKEMEEREVKADSGKKDEKGNKIREKVGMISLPKWSNFFQIIASDSVDKSFDFVQAVYKDRRVSKRLDEARRAAVEGIAPEAKALMGAIKSQGKSISPEQIAAIQAILAGQVASPEAIESDESEETTE